MLNPIKPLHVIHRILKPFFLVTSSPSNTKTPSGHGSVMVRSRSWSRCGAPPWWKSWPLRLGRGAKGPRVGGKLRNLVGGDWNHGIWLYVTGTIWEEWSHRTNSMIFQRGWYKGWVLALVPKWGKNGCVPKWCFRPCSKVILLPDIRLGMARLVEGRCLTISSTTFEARAHGVNYKEEWIDKRHPAARWLARDSRARPRQKP